MIEQYLRAVRSLIDTLRVSISDAIEMARVPAGIRDRVRVRYEEETALPIRRANVLSGTGGPRPWFQQWDPSTGYYWRRQRGYLIDRLGWNQADVGSLDDTTDRILSHLEDPRLQGPGQFDVRGLVMGYVQSGKTANFCALTAKAADAGYKLVIILSGIHNSLRLQTQRRINRALGLDPTGVPEPEPGRRWIGLTTPTLHGDFRPGTIDANVLQGNEHVLMVCKKNASVLRRLTGWIENRAPASLPVLIIDDEADQASINTGGNRPPFQEESDLSPDDLDNLQHLEDELDPSVINGLVRALVRSFSRVSYVAYTATPFANVLINHLAIDRDVFHDLYPRDFIVALPRPNGYTGAERLFGREPLPGEHDGQPSLDIIDLVPEHEADLLTPRGPEVDTFDPMICPSMRLAFLDFVLATAGRSQRSGADIPATMLIHTHHRKPVQNRLGEHLRGFVAEIRQSWRYDRTAIRPQLADRWNRRFRPVIASVDVSHDVPFDTIQEHVDRFFRDPVPVLVLNSDSTDELDFEADPNLKAVVVGGNRLSRGLTLEGLLVSFYLRRTECFDTLMQMGRWFGYREQYVDLTRIQTTAELSGWFRDLALAEEELRHEITRYERENLTPLDFGPRIRSHPVMMITAQNKMGSARTVSQNYSGYLLQTTAFRLEDRAWLESNLDAARQLLADIGQPNHPSATAARPVWADVPWQTVDAFLSRYRFDPRGSHEMGAIRQYLQAQARQDELIEWYVAVPGLSSRDDQLGTEPALSIRGMAINRISRTRLRNKPYDIGTLVNPATQGGTPGSGDEEIGLTDAQLAAARATVNEAGSFPRALRRQRNPRQGLLLLYPISPNSRPRSGIPSRQPLFDDPVRDGVTVVGMAMVSPVSESAATIEYVVGSVGSP
ncbi:MAG: Z1 domain-containing protein [Betaproteobacteria bacterium]|nr:Z1 domain-containing protein [Betaproteobacteria bacterium]